MVYKRASRKLSKLAEYRTRLYKKIAWAIFIVRCKDDTYYGGMTRDLTKELFLINTFMKGYYFHNHPERVPVELMYEEYIPFKEANAKYHYLRKMNKRLKKKLISTNKWPYGGDWKEFAEKNPRYVEVKNKLTCLRLETII